MSTTTLMTVGEVAAGKKSLEVIVSNKGLGKQSTLKVKHDDCLNSLGALKSQVSAPDALMAQSMENMSEPLAKFLSKEDAKYEKAMKKKKEKS